VFRPPPGTMSRPESGSSERKFHAKLNGTFTAGSGGPRKFNVIRSAFVLRLGSDTRPDQQHYVDDD
jgi:hypothetical protein